MNTDAFWKIITWLVAVTVILAFMWLIIWLGGKVYEEIWMIIVRTRVY